MIYQITLAWTYILKTVGEPNRERETACVHAPAQTKLRANKLQKPKTKDKKTPQSPSS